MAEKNTQLDMLRMQQQKQALMDALDETISQLSVLSTRAVELRRTLAIADKQLEQARIVASQTPTEPGRSE